jgi:hypothetical protein
VTGRSKIALAGCLALALVVCAGAGAAPAAAKKKSRTFEQSQAVNTVITDRPAVGNAIPTVFQITVPKKFKGKVVGDLNVTGIQTTGSAANAASHLDAWLTAPSGRTVPLWFGSLGGTSIGPLTLDDDTRTTICDSPTDDCTDPDQTLIRPFAGTANLAWLFNGLGPLSVFNGQRMRGTWSFSIMDHSNAVTSTLNSWGLRIKAAKPVPE